MFWSGGDRSATVRFSRAAFTCLRMDGGCSIAPAPAPDPAYWTRRAGSWQGRAGQGTTTAPDVDALDALIDAYITAEATSGPDGTEPACPPPAGRSTGIACGWSTGTWGNAPPGSPTPPATPHTRTPSDVIWTTPLDASDSGQALAAQHPSTSLLRGRARRPRSGRVHTLSRCRSHPTRATNRGDGRTAPAGQQPIHIRRLASQRGRSDRENCVLARPGRGFCLERGCGNLRF